MHQPDQSGFCSRDSEKKGALTMTESISPANSKEPYDQPILQRHGALLSITGASPTKTIVDNDNNNKNAADNKSSTDKTAADNKTTTDAKSVRDNVVPV